MGSRHWSNATDCSPGSRSCLVGEDPASHVYVRNKAQQTREVGMHSLEIRLPATTAQSELLERVARAERRPARARHPRAAAVAAADRCNRRDRGHRTGQGRRRLSPGQRRACSPRAAPGFVPCTPLGCLLLLKSQLASTLAGRAPSSSAARTSSASRWRNCCCARTARSPSRTRARAICPTECRRADVLVAAIGRPQMIPRRLGQAGRDRDRRRYQPHQRTAGTPRGRASSATSISTSAVEVAGAITPVPGGVGPMTIACLLRNTLTAATNSGRATPA